MYVNHVIMIMMLVVLVLPLVVYAEGEEVTNSDSKEVNIYLFYANI